MSLKINAKKLNVVMAERKLNFSLLAEKAGVSRPTLSYINNGKSCRPIILAKIAQALNVPVTDIIETSERDSD